VDHHLYLTEIVPGIGLEKADGAVTYHKSGGNRTEKYSQDNGKENNESHYEDIGFFIFIPGHVSKMAFPQNKHFFTSRMISAEHLPER
jgi:hypothetical protein